VNQIPWIPVRGLGSSGTQLHRSITILITLSARFTFLIHRSLLHGLDAEFTKAVFRVVADAGDPDLRGLDWPVTLVSNDHAVVDGLQLVDFAAFDDFLQALAELGFVIDAPPRNVYAIRGEVFRPEDEQRHEFEDVRLAVLEP
jgi:hypothetical protein